jgi:hypothetical protein
LLRLVDLDVVPGAVEQVQLAVREQGREVAGHPGVQVAVPGTENHPDGRAEAVHLRDAPPAGEHGGEQVVVQPAERRPGGQEIRVELRDELLTDLQPADLPGIQPPVQAGPPPDDRRTTGVEYSAMAGGRRSGGVKW